MVSSEFVMGQEEEKCAVCRKLRNGGNAKGSATRRVLTNSCPQNYKFTGKERDAESGNDDYGARYYASSLGRFLSPDWSAIPVPVPYANLSNPQTLNLYAMVSDNPETFADLDGHGQYGGFHLGLTGDAAVPQATSADALAMFEDAWDPSTFTTTPESVFGLPNSSATTDSGQGQQEQNQGNSVTVFYYTGRGPNPFGHSAMSVDGDKPIGLEPKNNLFTKILGAIEGLLTGVPYGHTAGEVAQVAAGRVPKETATIDITADQARNIRAFIKQESENHNQTYGVAGHNCTQFSEAALKAGGMSHVPNATTPRDLVEQLIKNGASPGP